MNIRQQAYKKNRIKLRMNQYNAAIAAGYSESTAAHKSKQLEERVGIADLMDRAGLTDDVLVEKHAELLEAKELVKIRGEAVSGENGVIWEPRLDIQTKALELAYKLKKLLVDKIDHSGKIEGSESKVYVINQIDLSERMKSVQDAVQRP